MAKASSPNLEATFENPVHILCVFVLQHHLGAATEINAYSSWTFQGYRQTWMLPNVQADCSHCHRDCTGPDSEHFDEKVHLVDLYVHIQTYTSILCIVF